MPSLQEMEEAVTCLQNHLATAVEHAVTEHKMPPWAVMEVVAHTVATAIHSGGLTRDRFVEFLDKWLTDPLFKAKMDEFIRTHRVMQNTLRDLGIKP
jgi:hypothetical protein